MRFNKLLSIALISLAATFTLSGCIKEEPPDFSDYKRIAELSTLDCTFHNVAEIYNDGTDILFGINVGYKKAWFEYDGKIQLGIDASKVKIEGPDVNNNVVISVPNARVLGIPDIDETTFSDIYQDTGLFTRIDTADQEQALQAAQAGMRAAAESNPEIMAQAKKRAAMLLSQYVEAIGQARGEKYTIQIVDVE